MKRAADRRLAPKDLWELRLMLKHGLPPTLARAYADIRHGRPD